MRLFAIRKEKGNLLIVTAADEQDAVRQAGLDLAAAKSVVAQLQKQGWTTDLETVIKGGIGPQFYEIRELPRFFLEFKLNDTGEFELDDIDLDTRETVYQMYPIIEAATDSAIVTWPGPLLNDEEKIAVRNFMTSAVEQERERFRFGRDSFVQ
jgi:hypothetical protein